MRRYDPATQRSVASIDQITIVPLSDQLTAGQRPAPQTAGLKPATTGWSIARRLAVFDSYLRPRQRRRADDRLRARRGGGERDQAHGAAPAQLRGGRQPRGTRVAARRAVRRLGRGRAPARPGHPPLAARGWMRRTGDPLPADGRAERPRRRLGRPRSASCATRATRRSLSRRRRAGPSGRSSC